MTTHTAPSPGPSPSPGGGRSRPSVLGLVMGYLIAALAGAVVISGLLAVLVLLWGVIL